MDFGDRPVAIHSGFRALRHRWESPTAFVDEVLDKCRRAVLFPTFTGTADDGPAKPPRLSVAETPCWTGLIPTAALALLGPEARTLHPTHSWVMARADEALIDSGLSAKTPCGPGTPLRWLAEQDGVIWLAGAGLSSLTLVHACEEEAEVDFVLQPEPLQMEVLDASGTRRLTPPIAIHSWAAPRDYPSLEPWLLERGLARRVEEGWLIEAEPTLAALTARLREDPSCVLESRT